jgi:hypothetical protein
MRRNMAWSVVCGLSPVVVLGGLNACEKKPESAASTADHAHAPDGSHPVEAPSAPGHGGAVIALGEQTIGSFLAKATRDEGQVVAGKDAPIDVTVTASGDAKVVAVRFWIGTEDAAGSVKAKAEIEDPNDPNRWHTHAEVPNPLPPESKLWVEIEDDKGGKSVGSFGLNM